jgi:hypothetical protein
VRISSGQLCGLAYCKERTDCSETATKSESGSKLGTNPSQHSLHDLSSLFLVGVGSGKAALLSRTDYSPLSS